MFEGAELYFNVDHGYLEGLVRGCKAGLLTQQDYINLVQCETLEGKCYPFHLKKKGVWGGEAGAGGGGWTTDAACWKLDWGL